MDLVPFVLIVTPEEQQNISDLLKHNFNLLQRNGSEEISKQITVCIYSNKPQKKNTCHKSDLMAHLEENQTKRNSLSFCC